MFVHDLSSKQQQLAALLNEPVTAIPGDFRHVVEAVLPHRDDLLRLARAEGSPCYVFDERSFDAALAEFRATFDAQIPRHRAFFAVKSNPHPWLLAAAVRAGLGLDVSSRRELAAALAADAQHILFSGPAKSPDDLEQAVRHHDRVLVQLDSFGELARLSAVASRLGVRQRCGVRIYSTTHGQWAKFGIPLSELARFWRQAAALPGIELSGIQSHLSWAHSPQPHREVIRDVAEYLAAEFTPAERETIRFYDFGGGYRPYRLEGRYPQELPQGELIRTLDEHSGETSRFVAPYYFYDTVPLADYAAGIGDAIRQQFGVDCPWEFYSEPGRVLATRSMHLLLQVVDRKGDDVAIVDGGIHMVGWERYLHIHAPIINLSRPATTEFPMRVYGSLCDPEDVFGQRVFGAAVEEGDYLLMPNQGAYSLTTAQNFIRDIPPVRRLRASQPDA